MKFTEIEMRTWQRRKHFQFFNRLDFPQYNVCAMVDITILQHHLKKQSKSTFKTMLYCVSRAANEVEELRMRIRGDDVVLHSSVHPSFTFLNEDELFSFCAVDYTPCMKTFIARTGAAMAQAQASPSLEDEPDRDDYLFISSLPWIRFTSISHPLHMQPVDSVPRITWGKAGPDGDRITMPVSIQVHHALVDGLHIGRFFDGLQRLLDEVEKSY
jgi:chloramphenicol O-acetyltransferase type A